MELVLFGLLGLGMIAIVVGNDADDDDMAQVDPPTPEGEPEPGPVTTPDITPDPDPEVEPLDTGASILENADGSLVVELGEDETGSLAALKVEQTSNGENFDRVFSLGLYLVPEGVELPQDTFGRGIDFDSVDALVSDLGLTELANYDLGTLQSELRGDGDTRVEPPVITSDDPIEIIRLRVAIGDGGESFITSETDATFSPFEEPGIFANGAALVETGQDYTGTDGADFVNAFGPQGAEGIRIDGSGGTDVIISNIADSTLNGGTGADGLYGVADGSTVNGGAGNDRLLVGTNGTAFGGTGNDDFSLLSADGVFGYDALRVEITEPVEDLRTSLFGGAGNDYFAIDRATARGFGDAGDDRFVLTNGGRGNGGEGNDFFNVCLGSIANGGAGDDLFQMVAFGEEPLGAAVVSGGAGADVYEFGIASALEPLAAQFLRITDFDPAEDVLRIEGFGGNSTLESVRAQEAPDGSYTDIIAVFRDPEPGVRGDGPVTATIRLDGVSGFTAAQLVA